MNYSKLGRRRKKKLKYRKAKGRHNKIRENMKGHPRKVSVGYKKSREAGKKEMKIIFNIAGLSKIKKGEEIMLSKIGKKKRTEMAKKAMEQGIKILNLNIKKFLKKIEKEKQEKEKTREKKKTEEKKKETKTEEKKSGEKK